MTSANERQPGGDHYKGDGSAPYQHWDFIHDARLDWCGANATKYISRWWVKGTPILDLQKTIHYLQKRSEQGIVDRVGHVVPYNRGVAMAAMQRWLDGGAAPVPEYEQGILTQIVMGNNDEAIALTQKLLDNEHVIADKSPVYPGSGRDSIKKSHRAEGQNFVD